MCRGRAGPGEPRGARQTWSWVAELRRRLPGMARRWIRRPTGNPAHFRLRRFPSSDRRRRPWRATPREIRTNLHLRAPSLRGAARAPFLQQAACNQSETKSSARSEPSFRVITAIDDCTSSTPAVAVMRQRDYLVAVHAVHVLGRHHALTMASSVACTVASKIGLSASFGSMLT